MGVEFSSLNRGARPRCRAVVVRARSGWLSILYPLDLIEFSKGDLEVGQALPSWVCSEFSEMVKMLAYDNKMIGCEKGRFVCLCIPWSLMWSGLILMTRQL